MIKALKKEIHLQRNALGRGRILSLYMGGGTPSLLRSTEIKELLDTLNKDYDLKSVKEFTLEANPEDITYEKLQQWLQLGINRLSIGIQSFHTPYLDLLGRESHKEQSLSACTLATSTGFRHISIDLIYGLQSKAIETWAEDIRLALSTGASHLSAYSLTLEPKTLLFHAYKKKTYKPPSSDEVADQLDLLHQRATQVGFRQYEVASFAQRGAEALHNQNYWKGVKYLGIGPSAHSYDGYRRWKNVSSNATYIRKLAQGTHPIEEIETLNRSMRWEELLCISLRTSKGLALKRVQALLGSHYADFEEIVDPLRSEGLLYKTPTHLRPTYHGLKIADEITLHILSRTKAF